jgi:hypothetical protein
LKGGSADAYCKKHADEIRTFKTSHDYLTRHLIGRKQIPLDDWKRELAGMSMQRNALIAESDKPAAELRSAEAIKRNAEIVLGVERCVRSLSRKP